MPDRNDGIAAKHASGNARNGIILLNKPSGITSFSVLNRVKKVINKKTGHAGTLDKFASGLLIALCGTATKKFDDFQNCDKEYKVLMEFGKSTDTQDPEGETIATSDRIPSMEEIQTAIKKKFTGNIIQTPPKYSAIHINGKRAYQMARGGKDFEMPERKVTIYDFKLLDYSYPYLSAIITVSKGCYIRSISYDLAQVLGIEGYTKELTRTRIGKYSL
ncbi:MAG TPA: tRNA pseudouridine(55) synthase TruB, partial [Spirochaetaceae bacterium]|nr:tRNA pseudouridine(55) synthase TruB [Spirochaetaceae bacterium]